MTIVNPSPIDALPPAPIKGQAGFSAAAEAFTVALHPFCEQANAIGAAAYNNALDAANSANSASASAATANAVLWVSGTNYSTGKAVISPQSLVNNISEVYIRKSPGGATTIDPKSDPTNWALYIVNNTLGGGAIINSGTLGNYYSVSCITSFFGCKLTLPNATTKLVGACYQVKNISEFPYEIINFNGDSVGFLKGSETTNIALLQNTTSSGVWSLSNVDVIGVVAKLEFMSGTANLLLRQCFYLTSEKLFIVFGVNSGALYTCTYELFSGIYSNILLCRTTHTLCKAAKISDTSILIVSHDGSTTMQAAVIALSGNSLTIGSATSDTTSSPQNFGELVNVGIGSYVLSYNRPYIGLIKAFYTSGGLVTIGAEVSTVHTDSSPPNIYASGSIVRAVCAMSGYIKCVPYSVSGVNLTVGALAQTASITANLRSYVNGNGNIVVFHANSGNWVASTFKITGTTEAVTNSNIASLGTYNGVARTHFEVLILGNNKTLFTGRGNDDTASSIFYTNIISDTNGVTSCGTAITHNLGYPAVFVQNKTNSGFAFISTIYSSLQNYCVNYDISGASPIHIGTTPSNGYTSSAAQSDSMCRSPGNLLIGNSGAKLIQNFQKVEITDFGKSGVTQDYLDTKISNYGMSYIGLTGSISAAYSALVQNVNNGQNVNTGLLVKVIKVV